MIRPVNGNLIIKPLERKSFFGEGKFEEIGTVLSISEELDYGLLGSQVLFDAWLAGKFPDPQGGEDDYIWLVRWSDVKAVIPKDDAVPDPIPK